MEERSKVTGELFVSKSSSKNLLFSFRPNFVSAENFCEILCRTLSEKYINIINKLLNINYYYQILMKKHIK